MLQWLQKVWEGNTVFEEAVCFLQDGDQMTGGTLLYTPSKILKVTKADGSSIYEEGKDYTISGKKLIRSAAGNIRLFKRVPVVSPLQEKRR